MGECNSTKIMEEKEYSYSTDVMTGGSNKRMYLYYQLISSLKKAESVDIIVSFLMESGVKMLIKELENALKRGARVRILTGNYLGITQPSALYLIKSKLGESVDLRFYNEKGRSFHPKSYIFHYRDYSEIYIGSSNISKSALTSGVEWNYRFSSHTDEKNYNKFYQAFEDLFENHSREKYDGIWACASILHLNKAELSGVFEKMSRALKKTGIIYTSFKYGDFEGMRNGRYFTDFTEESFASLLNNIPLLTIEKQWITGDARQGRENEKWYNIILKRG